MLHYLYSLIRAFLSLSSHLSSQFQSHCKIFPWQSGAEDKNLRSRIMIKRQICSLLHSVQTNHVRQRWYFPRTCLAAGFIANFYPANGLDSHFWTLCGYTWAENCLIKARQIRLRSSISHFLWCVVIKSALIEQSKLKIGFLHDQKHCSAQTQSQNLFLITDKTAKNKNLSLKKSNFIR